MSNRYIVFQRLIELRNMIIYMMASVDRFILEQIVSY